MPNIIKPLSIIADGSIVVDIAVGFMVLVGWDDIVGDTVGDFVTT